MAVNLGIPTLKSILLKCRSGYHLYAWCLGRSGTGVTDVCEPSCGYWEVNTGLLWEHTLLLLSHLSSLICSSEIVFLFWEWDWGLDSAHSIHAVLWMRMTTIGWRLNSWSPLDGTVWVNLEGVALLEVVCYVTGAKLWGFQSQEPFPVHSVYLLLMVGDVSSQSPCCHDSDWRTLRNHTPK